MDINDVDIPIYDCRKDNYVGVTENKNLRKSIGTKKQMKEKSLKLENSNLKKLFEYKNLPKEDIMRVELDKANSVHTQNLPNSRMDHLEQNLEHLQRSGGKSRNQLKKT